ncbi:MAG: ribosome small subunit-dependent GTPase A [Sphaerochaetaceae bacterium]|nr:ribosome small subunit-dependent GTPase A [Sphaerochaetaceae bacterium]
MKGQVIFTINNIISVKETNGRYYVCRFKGKYLSGLDVEYNPLAVGDFVEFDDINEKEGLITSRLERNNCFQRFNGKKNCNQTVVANMDIIACVCSVSSPPFRPRFVDRVLVCAKNVEVMVILNKSDILLTEDEYDRIALYKKLGYKVKSISCKTGDGVEELKETFKGKKIALVGQSGVGKSSLVNILMGSEEQKIGEISTKYNRGRHTTNFSKMLEADGFILVDTPGVREFVPPHDDPHEIAKAFIEFREPSEKCAFEGCLHDLEQDCEVKRLVEQGKINADRYNSYLGLIHSLKDKTPFWTRK